MFLIFAKVSRRSTAYDPWQIQIVAFAVSTTVKAGLAKNFANLKFIVQDSANALVGVNSTIPSELAGQVTFQKHELFAPQDAKADVYFFRMVFRGSGDAFAT